MAFADSDGTGIYYEDTGKGEPVLLCLPGWCVHHTIFTPLAKRLSAHHRVVAVDWRGHGNSQPSEKDFGYAEMLADVLAVIRASGAREVIPIAQAHGGWVAIELRRKLQHRLTKMVCISWNPIFTTGDPLASPFLRARQALQDHARWRETLEQMLTGWLIGAPASVNTHIRKEMESHGFEDWARAGREISAMYARQGNPLQALARLNPPVSVLHVYVEPHAPEYLSVQKSFARDHSWFAVRRLQAVSHFPTLEITDETADVITEFIQTQTA